MKLLTLNTHSLLEENYGQKLEQAAAVILREMPDVMAMQEVNQSVTAPLAGQELLEGFFPCPDGKIPVRADNHAAQIARRLRAAGVSCSWTWISAKIGYEKYDEGMALFCLGNPITAAEAFYISECRDYRNWKTRRVLGIQTGGVQDWFFTVHMGWWQDEEEPFLSQWERFESVLRQKKDKGSDIWLMGDFNSPADFRGQGYDRIRDSGWQDTYELAEDKDNGFTVKGCIDGWRPCTENEAMPEGMRIDHIWCSRPVPVQKSSVIFNGVNGPVVSDHFGVLVRTI